MPLLLPDGPVIAAVRIALTATDKTAFHGRACNQMAQKITMLESLIARKNPFGIETSCELYNFSFSYSLRRDIYSDTAILICSIF